MTLAPDLIRESLSDASRSSQNWPKGIKCGNLQDVGFQVELSGVECCVDGQVDGVLGLSGVVVVNEGRVGRDLVSRGEPTDKVFLKIRLFLIAIHDGHSVKL